MCIHQWKQKENSWRSFQEFMVKFMVRKLKKQVFFKVKYYFHRLRKSAKIFDNKGIHVWEKLFILSNICTKG